MTIKEAKTVLRQELLTVERCLPNDYRDSSGNLILSALLTMKSYHRAKCVSCFVGTGLEIDTLPLIRDALERGKRLCAPRCTQPGVLEMHLITSLNDLTPGALGILEPEADTEAVDPSEISLLLAPCLACDRSGNRLGRGGGYYDRYLSTYHGLTILLCREALIQPEIPVEPHDIAVPLVLSEQNFYQGGSPSEA